MPVAHLSAVILRYATSLVMHSPSTQNAITKSAVTRNVMLPSVALLGFLLPLPAIAQTADFSPSPYTYSSLNIFGDSLVDTGNIFNLTGRPPSPPYAQKLSNDTLWVEPFADALNLSPTLSSEALPNLLSGAPAPTEGINFALAGSLSSDQSTAPPLPGLQQQLETFQSISPLLPTDDNSLFVIVAGANDYNSAIANPTNPTTPESLTNQVTDNLTNAASALIDTGAKNLLIANLPNLGLQPFAKQLNQINPQSSTLLTSLAAGHNQLLSQKLTTLADTTGVNITSLDLNEIFTDIENDPARFGFTNIEDSCLTNFQPGFQFEGICDNPDEFVFWDNVHPTAAAHDIIAQFALTALKDDKKEGQEVPEPSVVFSLLSVGGMVLLRNRTGSRNKVRR